MVKKMKIREANIQFDLEEFQETLEVLKKFDFYDSIVFERAIYSDEKLSICYKFLISIEHLKSLEFKNIKFSEEGFDVLFTKILKRTNIDTLKFIDIDNDSYKSLSKFLEDEKNLKSIEISNKKLKSKKC